MDEDMPFIIPFQEQWLIYKPRRHLAFVGNEALVTYLAKRQKGSGTCVRKQDIESYLEAIGYDQPSLACAPAVIPELGPQPTSAVLLMTNRCNLRCVYCYANAGEESQVVEMKWPTAKAVIDYVIANAAKTGTEIPALTFHGGGEPTVHWDLMVRCVEYARKQDPRMSVSMSSNGVWTREQTDFICSRFTNVSLSMDGAPDVQNAQRPLAFGGDSFPLVRDSIRAMDDAGVEYGIRMTVLLESVATLPQGVRDICENTRARAIQVEPTFTSKRGHYSDITTDFADTFTSTFMEAWQIGRNYGRQVYYSGARPWVIAPMFCLAPLKAAVVTADGRLVTCFEVFSEQNPLAGGFTVGCVSDGAVAYDLKALQAFLDDQQRRRAECVDCFCYWHCCGDCATRRPGKRNESEGRCRVTRQITLALLQYSMAESGGMWQGLRDTQYSPSGCEVRETERGINLGEGA